MRGGGLGEGGLGLRTGTSGFFAGTTGGVGSTGAGGGDLGEAGGGFEVLREGKPGGLSAGVELSLRGGSEGLSWD